MESNQGVEGYGLYEVVWPLCVCYFPDGDGQDDRFLQGIGQNECHIGDVTL